MTRTTEKPAGSGQLSFEGIGPRVEDIDIVAEIIQAVEGNGGHLRLDVYHNQHGLILWASGKNAPEWVLTIPQELLAKRALITSENRVE